VKVTAQDYDGSRCRRRCTLPRCRSGIRSTHQRRTETAVASKDATTGADGTVLVDLPLGGSGDFQITASAQTPENRTVQGQTWVWIWNGAGAWYQPNAQAQIVADKKSYQVGDTAHLLLVTGLNESWAVVTAEGDSVQSRA
jgi:alpha-2-macroglobulin